MIHSRYDVLQEASGLGSPPGTLSLGQLACRSSVRTSCQCAHLVSQAAALLVAMPHAFCYVDLSKDLGGGGRKRRRKAVYVQPEDAALHAANVSSRTSSELIPPRLPQAIFCCEYAYKCLRQPAVLDIVLGSK
jgi:hypothetical protein